MTINRTTLLDLPLPVTGTESGVWGDVVNNGLSQYIDISVAGSLSLSADSDTNLSSTEGDASATNIGSTTAQYAILRCTGARTATRNINAPAWAISGGTLTNYSKIYIVVNETTGSQNIVLRATNSATPTYTTGVTIVPGERAVCAWNGSDFVKVGGAAGGSTTQVQFNNAGVFGGITNATTDGTTLSMTSPKVITSINDTNGNELFKLTATGSAVNEVTVANAATGNNPVLSATGNDTNIGINLTPKGSGAIKLSGLSYPTADGSANQAIVTNGSGTLSFATISTAAATPTALGTVYGNTPSAGTYGTFLGYQAGNVTTGANNVAIGNQAFLINTTGAANTAVGTVALGSNITGSNNVAVGSGSLYTNTASNNTGIGTDALRLNTTGTQNTAVGFEALKANTTGTDNTAVGYQALDVNTTGVANTALGSGALGANTTASNNTAIGYQALLVNTTGTANVAVGYQPLYLNTTGERNIAVGYQAGYNNTASKNLFIGYQVGYSNTSGTGNSFVGGSDADNWPPGYANTTGSDNTAFGGGALRSNTTASNNVAIGTKALHLNTTGTNNVAVGYQALDANTTGSENTALGYDALGVSQTVSGNTAIGTRALQANTTGTSNVAVGAASLQSNTTGSFNAAFGANIVGVETGALGTNTTGSYNTALGVSALKANTTASYNTAVGTQALYVANRTADGNAYNVSIGYQSGYSLTTGQFSTFVGAQAGYSTTGNNNTFVGPFSGYYVTSGASNTILGRYGGNQDGLDIRSSSNYVVLSDGDGNRQASMAEGKSLALDSAVPQSGTGITFPATQSASSDANTLDDYEEGTWTPNQGAGLTVSGSFQSVGTYIKIGRLVVVRGSVGASTSVSISPNGIICSNLPFSNGGSSSGNSYEFGTGSSVQRNALATGGQVAADQNTNLYSVSTYTAVTAISFVCTYITA